MPALETRDRKQDAVLWQRSGYDKHGQATVEQPVALKVRWEDKFVEVLDPKGNTIGVDATAVVDRNVSVGSIMWLGCLDKLGPGASPQGLMEVKAFNSTPDIRNRAQRRTVGLMRFRDKLPTIQMVTSAISLTSSPNPSASGQQVTLTATVSPFAPNGSVEFFDGDVLLGAANPMASSAVFFTQSLGVGGHSLTARFLGDQTLTRSTSDMHVHVVS